jgi:hypothetical protein
MGCSSCIVKRSLLNKGCNILFDLGMQSLVPGIVILDEWNWDGTGAELGSGLDQ